MTQMLSEPVRRLFKPDRDCPRLSVIVRWGCPSGMSPYWLRWTMLTNAARLARNRYMFFPVDYTVKVGYAGYRLPVVDRVICCYQGEVRLAETILGGYPELASFRVLPRPRSTFGDEGQYMERNLIDNPGYLCICDAGLNQVLPPDRTPGQGRLSPEDWSSKVAFMLRCAKSLGVKLVSPRHQDNIGSQVEGLPPHSNAAATGFLNVEKPDLRFVQQLMFFAAAAKGAWPSGWNHLEDRYRAENEQKVSGKGSVAVFEGCSVRFPEKKTTKERHCGDPEWRRRRDTLRDEYGVKLMERHPRHQTPGINQE